MSTFTILTDWYSVVGSKLVVEKPLAWEVGCLGSGLFVTVPLGFNFDVSVPRGLRWFVSPLDSRLFKAAALHDYALGVGWDRVSSAALFSEALATEKIHKFKRLLLVVAVIAWNWR